MSEQARIDGLKFAREGTHLHGELAVADLPRLDDIVFERAGVVSYALSGSSNSEDKPILDIEVKATLALVCQRCLGRMDYELQRKSRFVLIESGRSLPEVENEDPGTENICADAVSDVSDIVEQEVLLGLPIAPVHPEGTCEERPALPPDPSQSPFAELGKLKKR